MIDVGIVHGGEEQAKPLIVGKTTVYVHTDIHEVEVPDHDDPEQTHIEYEYHEYTYDKDEYIELMSNNEEKMNSDILYIAMMSDIDLDD